MDIRITGSENKSARRKKETQHRETQPVGQEHEEQRAQREQVSARRARDLGPASRHPHAALDEVEEKRAQQAANQGHEAQVEQEPAVRQAKQEKAEVDAEERIRLAQRDRVPRQQEIEPVAGGPVAHRVAHEQDSHPDDPAEQGAEALEDGELDRFLVNVEGIAAGHSTGDQEVDAYDDHEAHAGKAAQRDLSLEDRRVDDPETLLAEPEPIDQEVKAAGEERGKNQEEQDKGQDETRQTV